MLLDLVLLQTLQAGTRLSSVSVPPKDLGITWSIASASLPQ